MNLHSLAPSNVYDVFSVKAGQKLQGRILVGINNMKNILE